MNILTLGERIKKVRRDADLTQQEFCNRIGFKQNSISLVESGKRNISNQAIKSICREFNVSETWLRTGEGEISNPSLNTEIDALVNKYHLSDIGRFIIEGYIHLTESDRAIFDQQLKKIFDRWAKKAVPTAHYHLTDSEIEAEGERVKRELYAQRDAEIAKETALDPATIRVINANEEEEKFVAQAADLARKQFILEKKQAAQACSAKEQDAS